MRLFKSMAAVRLVHSAIWMVMATATVYVFYCGVFGVFNGLLYFSLILLTLEIVTLILYGWNCPLTIVAKEIDPKWKDGDDIFLPKWLAIHNKLIFGTLLTVGVLLLMLRWFDLV